MQYYKLHLNWINFFLCKSFYRNFMFIHLLLNYIFICCIDSSILQPYRARDRGTTEIFLDTNYFTDYVSVSKDFSIKDHDLEYQTKRRMQPSIYNQYPINVLLKVWALKKY